MTAAAGGPSPARPRVVLVGLGGTIAITGSDEAGVAHGRDVTDLLASLPGITVVSSVVGPGRHETDTDADTDTDGGGRRVDARWVRSVAQIVETLDAEKVAATGTADPDADAAEATTGAGGRPGIRAAARARAAGSDVDGEAPGPGPAGGRLVAAAGTDVDGEAPGPGPAGGRLVAAAGTDVGTEPAGGEPAGGEPSGGMRARGEAERSGDGIDLDAVELRMLPGSALSPDDLATTAAVVRERLEAGAAGVVVTQGTDTIEETAYFLDLLHYRAEPVVVTGAMRGPRLDGDDGPANLLAAIRTAASPRARQLGCVVVFADEIHAASRVRKTHASSIATFASPNGGPLGYLVEGQPRILNRPTTRAIVPPPSRRWPRVGFVTATFGAPFDVTTGDLDGLVVAGFGVGHVPPTWVPVLANVARRIPVVLASRTGAGAVHAAMYDYAGSERDLRRRGLIPAGFLHPYKARILLLLALAAGLDRDTVGAVFADAGR
jgi:L-asparaginase